MNKYNPPEVLATLFHALGAAGLDETIIRLKALKVPQIVNDAWQTRPKLATRLAAADVKFIRQSSQYSCVAASVTSALKACGKDVTEEEVNKVLCAAPMAGASWEQALATIQYFGCRGTLVVPATLKMVKQWTDKGHPVLIAWNPEGRPWSHASVVFDVTDNLDVKVMDPNCPDPEQTVRVLDKVTFYSKWMEKICDSLLVRRPALMVEREVTPDGRQVIAGGRIRGYTKDVCMLDDFNYWSQPKEAKKRPQPVAPPKKDDSRTVHVEKGKPRDEVFRQMIETGKSDAAHKNRERDLAKGHSRKEKHKKPWDAKEAASRIADAYIGKGLLNG